MSVALETTLSPKTDKDGGLAGAAGTDRHDGTPPELQELHDQIRKARQQLGNIEDRIARRGRRLARVQALRMELALGEEHAEAARLGAESTARGLADWILRRDPAPDGSLADRQEDAERASQRVRGLREQLRVSEQKLADAEAGDSDAQNDAAAAAARLRQLLERRLELLHELADVPAEIRREAAYDLAICIRRGVGWLERVCTELEGVRRYVNNIASACAPRASVLGSRPPRRTPGGVEEDYLEAQTLYRAARSAAEGAQRELGLLLGVPHRSPAFEELENGLARPRDALELATLAAWELGHRLNEARALAAQYAPRLRELDDRASGGREKA